MPIPPTTLPSRAITFKGFLTTLILSREEVVTIRGSIHRAQPPFHRFFSYRESNEPNLVPCRARSKRADPILPELPRLSSFRGSWNSRPCLPKGWPRVPLSLTDAPGALSPRSSLFPILYRPECRVMCGHDEKHSRSREKRSSRVGSTKGSSRPPSLQGGLEVPWFFRGHGLLVP
ncbi:hypothetical protein CRG98_006452 [Punica granatum]|uniref:Uncharacterized protein n=1 Tax=Punica granatum TaxID=22663 RepID=A0A2I0KXF6_PUNGR|nr:hypothetical protein CRG98_006452 [Punica granatum]